MPLSEPSVLVAFLELVAESGLFLLVCFGIPCAIFCVLSVRNDKKQIVPEKKQRREWLSLRRDGEDYTVL